MQARGHDLLRPPAVKTSRTCARIRAARSPCVPRAARCPWATCRPRTPRSAVAAATFSSPEKPAGPADVVWGWFSTITRTRCVFTGPEFPRPMPPRLPLLRVGCEAEPSTGAASEHLRFARRRPRSDAVYEVEGVPPRKGACQPPIARRRLARDVGHLRRRAGRASTRSLRSIQAPSTPHRGGPNEATVARTPAKKRAGKEQSRCPRAVPAQPPDLHEGGKPCRGRVRRRRRRGSKGRPSEAEGRILMMAISWSVAELGRGGRRRPPRGGSGPSATPESATWGRISRTPGT